MLYFDLYLTKFVVSYEKDRRTDRAVEFVEKTLISRYTFLKIYISLSLFKTQFGVSYEKDGRTDRLVEFERKTLILRLEVLIVGSGRAKRKKISSDENGLTILETDFRKQLSRFNFLCFHSFNHEVLSCHSRSCWSCWSCQG